MLFCIILLFLALGLYSFLVTVIMMIRGRYHPWARGISDLLMGVFLIGFASAMGLLVRGAGQWHSLVPGFAVLAGSALAVPVSLLIRARTGGGFGPTPQGTDAAALQRNQAITAKVLRFLGVPPQAIAAATAPPAPPPPPHTLNPATLCRPNPCAAPPRPVPFLTRLQVLLGGPLNQMGWVVFGFGMVFFWLFVCRADLSSSYRFRGRLVTASGRVTDSSNTGATEGGSKHHSGTPIYKNEYSFVVEDKEYHGAAYATGRELQAGRPVTVEYVPGKPGVSRIQGMRTNVFGPGVVFVLIFPLVGLGFLAFGMVRGLKACRLLANGVPTSARLVGKAPTNTRVNGRRVYEYTFTFKTLEDRVCSATRRSDADRFASGSQEHIVFDPRQPEQALLLEDLPGAPRIGGDGHLVTRRPALALAYAVLPAVALLGHGYWAVWLLGHG